MENDCDGGGNRYLSQIDLEKKPHLKSLFTGRTVVPAGVCSIRVSSGEPPWIVCPRRLLVLGKKGRDSKNTRQPQVLDKLLTLCDEKSGTRLGVWSEVKVQYSENVNEIAKSFDYTFDYVVMPLRSLRQDQMEKVFQKPWKRIRRILELGGYQIFQEAGTDHVRDFPDPDGRPTIVEIMTSSTSGGNQRKRTTIPLAFEDAVSGNIHEAPGINYRQVWARMVSQLVVKSEVAIGWGGRTVWVLQDVLIDYISKTTALDIKAFEAMLPSEVNILAFAYGKSIEIEGLQNLCDGKLYAGPISNTKTEFRGMGSFQDIIRAPLQPPIQRLLEVLSINPPVGTIIAP